MKNKQAMLPGVGEPVTLTIRFGPQSSTWIRDLKAQMNKKLPEIPLNDTDICRYLLQLGMNMVHEKKSGDYNVKKPISTSL